MNKYKQLTLKQYDKNAPHIIVEGETEALAAYKTGMPCFSLKGVASWHSKSNDKPGDA